MQHHTWSTNPTLSVMQHHTRSTNPTLIVISESPVTLFNQSYYFDYNYYYITYTGYTEVYTYKVIYSRHDTCE